MSDDVYEKLSALQKVLKVPKKRYNKHLNHYYRNCEDILQAVKQVMPEGATIRLSDDLVQIGDRYYVKSSAIFSYKGQEIISTAFAREPLENLKQAAMQITGSTSTYSRRYSLNALLCLDDNKDPDEEDKEDPAEEGKKDQAPHLEEKISNDRALRIAERVTSVGANHKKLCEKYGVASFNDLSPDMADHLERGLDKITNQIKGSEYARV